MSSFGTSAPFLLWVHYMDPHWWYTPPPPFDTAYSPALPEWTAFHEGTFDGSVPAGTVYFSNPLSAQGRQRGIDLYDGEIRYTDQEIGRLLREIDARGLAARTLVVFTADHGESLGEHGITFCHGYFTYEDNLHVPLVLAGPGIAKGRVAVPLSLVDLKETILRAVDPARPARPPSRICGESEPVYGSSGIHPDIAGRPRAYVPGDKGKWRSVRDGNLKLIRIPGQPGSELELYDLAADPGEAHDVAAARPADRDRLAAELDAP
ncbi:MAG: sulfatase-like hydrolase/transferase [Acidobacteriota bacterium]